MTFAYYTTSPGVSFTEFLENTLRKGIRQLDLVSSFFFPLHKLPCLKQTHQNNNVDFPSAAHSQNPSPDDEFCLRHQFRAAAQLRR